MLVMRATTTETTMIICAMMIGALMLYTIQVVGGAMKIIGCIYLMICCFRFKRWGYEQMIETRYTILPFLFFDKPGKWRTDGRQMVTVSSNFCLSVEVGGFMTSHSAFPVPIILDWTPQLSC